VSPARVVLHLLADFIAPHYPIFTVGHRVFPLVTVLSAGLGGRVGDLLVISVAVGLSHLVELGLNWSGQGECNG